MTRTFAEREDSERAAERTAEAARVAAADSLVALSRGDAAAALRAFVGGLKAYRPVEYVLAMRARARRLEPVYAVRPPELPDVFEVITWDRHGKVRVRRELEGMPPAELVARLVDLGCAEDGSCTEDDARRDVVRLAKKWIASGRVIEGELPCSMCGTVTEERSPCPDCKRVFCQECAEAPYEVGCDGEPHE